MSAPATTAATTATTVKPELDADNYHFYPSCFYRNIHVKSVISHKKGKFVFDGYFYLHPGVFRPDKPVKMLMMFKRHIFLIAVHKKVDVEDTSEYWSDDDDMPGRICLFPTKRTELHYNALEINPSRERVNELKEEIESGFESLREESYELQRKQEEQERKEWWLRESGDESTLQETEES
jgi:hypothetical protein